MACKAIIILGWPDSKLSPNYGDSNRFMKRRLRAEQRESAIEDCLWSVADDWSPFSGRGKMTVIFHPKDRRRRDLDNLFAMIKQAIDGICETLGIDDSQLHPVVLDFGEPDAERPYIEIEIEDLMEDDAFYIAAAQSRAAGVTKVMRADEVEARVRGLMASHRLTANEIHRRVGGNRNRVLTLVRQIRGER